MFPRCRTCRYFRQVYVSKSFVGLPVSTFLLRPTNTSFDMPVEIKTPNHLSGPPEAEELIPKRAWLPPDYQAEHNKRGLIRAKQFSRDVANCCSINKYWSFVRVLFTQESSQERGISRAFIFHTATTTECISCQLSRFHCHEGARRRHGDPNFSKLHLL